MFLCDFKSGDLRDDHELEARYYALVSTLRNGCAPYRSTVLSLASGEWTEPDVTGDDLIALAHVIVDAVNRHVQILTEQREPNLQPGMHCTWCPAKAACQAHSMWREAGMPADAPVVLGRSTGATPEPPLAEVHAEVHAEVRAAEELMPVSVGVADDDPFAI
jgi:hypothetical protein